LLRTLDIYDRERHHVGVARHVRIEGVAMSVRRCLSALVAGVAVAAGAVAVVATGEVAAVAAVACSGTVWAEGVSYPAGQQVTYGGHLYQALVTSGNTASTASASTSRPG
jgi:hypothetical protein